MSAPERHLHAVPPCALEEAVTGELGDLGLTATIFAVALLPIVCDLAGLGRWGGGSLGLGTLGALLAGRELGAWARRALSGQERRFRHSGRPSERCSSRATSSGGDTGSASPRP